MRKKTLYAFLIFILFIGMVVITEAHPSLYVIVTTDKQTYGVGEVIQIYGNLTLAGSPVPDGLVAIETDNPRNTPFIIRTLPTGTTPTEDWIIEILEVTPCDSTGNPKGSFKRGTRANIKITIRNNDNDSRYALLAYTIFDSNEVPIVVSQFGASMPPGNSTYVDMGAPLIPDWASLGTAHVYVSVFTAWPKNGGTPYSPEKSATFQITSGSSSKATTSTTETTYLTYTEGTYNLTFRLPRHVPAGNYTIYVTSRYGEQNATNSTTFEVILIGDVNGDGVVDMMDVSLACYAAFTSPSDPRWDPRCDVDENGVVDMMDIAIICYHFLEGG